MSYSGRNKVVHIVLVEPEIPQNTGNIARTCVMTSSTLHLVGKLGFSLDDRYLRRAGLDYWPKLVLHHYGNFEELYRLYKNNNYYFFTTTAEKLYTDVSYTEQDFLVFGSETKGLPPLLKENWKKHLLRIPISREMPRSLNLSNTVAVAVYEALRQQNFPGMH
jgi:tRNA (cytidine/uridine-2'-O-)-methyltransferase